MTFIEPAAGPEPPKILRRSGAERDADAVSFPALRSLGIQATQALSGNVWTDYNLHDPGVTILEALAYALTELAYRADQSVPDHLADDAGRIDFERQSLFRPDDILRCRATTESDYRRILLDGGPDEPGSDPAPDLADVRFAPTRIPGLHHLRLQMADRHGAGGRQAAEAARAAGASRQARRLYSRARTLGEDLGVVEVITPTDCELSLTASIAGTRDAADILAEIYRKCAARIAGQATVRSLAELMTTHELADVLNGPLTWNGIIQEPDLPRGARESPPISDLRTIILGVEGVIEIVALHIAVDGDGTSRGPWSLRTPCGDASDAALVDKIDLRRRGVKVSVDPRAVASRHDHRFYPHLASGADRAQFNDVVPLPKGRERPRPVFRSVQEEFPVIYGLGRRGAGGAGDSVQARARVRQMQGYLALFDQLLANAGAQMIHIRDLFTTRVPTDRSYWRHILSERDAPGVGDLWDPHSAEDLLEHVFATFDPGAERRSRVLDHLLALYGETCSQNTLKQFLDHLDSQEQTKVLFRNKAQYLCQTVLLGRDRGAGFDVSRGPWGPPEETTGLHARLCLLLGFRYWWARPLTRRLNARRLSAPAADRGAAARSAGAQANASVRPVTWRDLTQPGAGEDAAFDRISGDGGLQALLLANAGNRERFRWRPAGGRAGVLLLADADDRLHELAPLGSEAVAANVAFRLRRYAMRLNEASEGLHLVEHILLRERPADADAAPDVGPDQDWAFLTLRVTVVLPAWTGRTSRPAFRDFAAETVEINSPAHVAAECLWLDFPAMQAFEGLYDTWAKALARHAQSEPRAAARQALTALNRASRALMWFLKVRQAPAAFDALHAAWTERRQAHELSPSKASRGDLAATLQAVDAFLTWNVEDGRVRSEFARRHAAWLSLGGSPSAAAERPALVALDQVLDTLPARLRAAAEAP